MHFGLLTRRLSICALSALAVSLFSLPLSAAPKKPGKTPKEPAAEEEMAAEPAASEKDPTTFADALERGKMALEQSQADAEGVRIMEEQKDNENLPKMRKDMATNDALAYRLLRVALSLADKGKEKVDVKDVNSVRYFLAFMNFQRGRYYDSAVIGDFLARNAPETIEGRQGAKIALASFRKMYDDSKQPEKDRTFEIEHIEQIAGFITKQWPNEEEAQDASQTLLNFAIQQHQLDRAIEYLKQIPETSPNRSNSELRTAQALWATYLRAPLSPPKERPSAEQLERYRSQAEKLFTSAVARFRKPPGTVSPVAVRAMLSLAQIYLDMSENDKAVAALEDEQFGPLTMIKAKDPSTSDPQLVIATYKVALRAYIATLDVQMAIKVMNSLEKRIGNTNDPKAAENLTSIYIGLGRELQQHLERLRQIGNKKELDAVSTAFETFLKRIVERGGGSSFNSLSWVAENFYSLAKGLDDDSPEPPEKAKLYYANAAKGYEQILERAKQDPKFVPDPQALIGIRLRLAISERRVGHFNTAIKLISEVLEARPKLVPLQIEAAETYQLSGSVDKDGYLTAIAGGEKTAKGENLVWGWGKLAKMTQNEEKYQDTFFQARLKIAECRYLYALKAADKAKHDEYMNRAKKELSIIYKLFPELGGPVWYAQYDELAKKVQKELSEKPVGMEEFKEPAPPNAQAGK